LILGFGVGAADARAVVPLIWFMVFAKDDMWVAVGCVEMCVWSMCIGADYSFNREVVACSLVERRRHCG
jgi:hypothetical protein